MLTNEEPLASVIEQHRTFSAQRFGNQRLLSATCRSTPPWGRVYLKNCDDSTVGPRAPAAREAVPGSNGWVCRRCEDLPDSASGQDDDWCQRSTNAIPLTFTHHVQRQPLSCTLGIDQQVQDECVFDQFDSVILGHGMHERTADLHSRRVTARVSDSIALVSTFTRERECPGIIEVERRTPTHKPTHGRRTLIGEYPNGVGVAQTCTGNHRVGEVLRWRIVLGERCGNPALSPPR
jgi:hypothetical protein